MEYDWNLRVLLNPVFARALLQGFLTTIRLTWWCIVIGTPLGVILGMLASIGRVSDERRMGEGQPSVARRIATALLRSAILVFVDIVRAIPLLLLIITAYYALPIFIEKNIIGILAAKAGFPKPSTSAFLCAVVAMSINLAAFVADLVRGAALGVSQASVMAARSLGMGPWLTWRRIIFPEVVREVLPGMVLLYITMLKMSTLASTIAVYEVMHSAEAIIQETYKPLELYLAVCVLFVALIVPLSLFGRWLEQTQYFRRRSVG